MEQVQCVLQEQQKNHKSIHKEEIMQLTHYTEIEVSTELMNNMQIMS